MIQGQNEIIAQWTPAPDSIRCAVSIQIDDHIFTEYPALKGEEGIIFSDSEFQQCTEHKVAAKYVSESNETGLVTDYVFRKSKF